MKRIFMAGVYFAVCSLIALAQDDGQGRVPSIPEIDGSVVPAVMALVGGGILMLRARLRSK